MSGRPTLADVAAAAELSTATVDRVLNSRLPVREATALRVISAAERIGYHGAGLMRARLAEQMTKVSSAGGNQRTLTLGFCLLRRHQAFYSAFGQALTAAAAAHSPQACRAVVEHLEDLAPAVLAERMLQLGKTVDALGVVAVDHPHISAAIEVLHAQGRPTFALLSDLSAPQRAGYVGVDPRKSGRTAAWAISRLARAPGPVGVFVGSHRYLGHEACEMSFRAYLREHAPAFRVLETQVNLEQAEVAFEATLALLRRHPDLAGLYDAGGGGMAGTLRALRAWREDSPGARPAARVVTVSNELTPEHRTALADGIVDLVLDTPQAAIAQRVVLAMAEALALPLARRPQGLQLMLPVTLCTAENM